MRPLKSNHNEAGFTLLELLLVVGVGALLLIGGIATYRLVSEGNKVTDTTRLIMTVRNEAQTLAQGQSYSGIDKALQDAKVITQGQKNAFGGDFTVTGDTKLQINLTNVPANACRKLAMSIKDQGIKLNTVDPPKTMSEAPCGNPDANNLSWEFP